MSRLKYHLSNSLHLHFIDEEAEAHGGLAALQGGRAPKCWRQDSNPGLLSASKTDAPYQYARLTVSMGQDREGIGWAVIFLTLGFQRQERRLE